MILKNAYISISAKDLSGYTKSVTLAYEAEMQDDTTMGDDTRSNMAGLKNWSIDVELVQDYADTEVDATLFPLIGAAPFAVILRPDAGARGAANPEYTADAVLESYPPLSGAVGDLATATITLRPGKSGAGSHTLVRNVVP